MYLRTLLIVLVLGVVVICALLNWSVCTAPPPLSIGCPTVEAPLGLILLGAIGALTLLFLIYLVYLQASALMESRQYSRELKNQRELADRAEESRFTELRSSLETEVRTGSRSTLGHRAVNELIIGVHRRNRRSPREDRWQSQSESQPRPIKLERMRDSAAQKN